MAKSYYIFLIFSLISSSIMKSVKIVNNSSKTVKIDNISIDENLKEKCGYIFVFPFEIDSQQEDEIKDIMSFSAIFKNIKYEFYKLKDETTIIFSEKNGTILIDRKD